MGQFHSSDPLGGLIRKRLISKFSPEDMPETPESTLTNFQTKESLQWP